MTTNLNTGDRPHLPNELGYLICNENGVISQSSGQLENDNKTAEIVSEMVNCLERGQSLLSDDGSAFSTIIIQYDDYLYHVYSGVNKITVIKRSHQPVLVDISA